MSLGRNILTRRRVAGLSQRELAKEVGVSHVAVHNWESDISLPKAQLLPLLARVLGCSIDELYNHDEEAS